MRFAVQARSLSIAMSVVLMSIGIPVILFGCVTGKCFSRPTIPEPGGSALTDQAILLRKSKESLAVVQAVFEGEDFPRIMARGLGLCYRTDGQGRSFFVTSCLAPASQPFLLRLTIMHVGASKQLEAKWISTDYASGLSIIEAQGSGEWLPVPIPVGAEVQPGERVTSVGVLDVYLGHQIILDRGNVSAIVRDPGRLVIVSGLRLASAGSPVFSSEGSVIGLIRCGPSFSFTPPLPHSISAFAVPDARHATQFVPAEEVARVIQARRRVDWAFGSIGAICKLLPSAKAGELGLKEPAVIVESIVNGSTAQRAGLRQGDIIIGLNGQPIERLSTPELTAAGFGRGIMVLAPGSRIRLSVLSGIVERSIEVDVEPASFARRWTFRYFCRNLGLGVRELGVFDDMKTTESEGVEVYSVDRAGPSWSAGVRAEPPDRIVAVNGHRIEYFWDFRDLVNLAVEASPDKAVVLGIVRSGRNLTVPIQLETGNNARAVGN